MAHQSLTYRNRALAHRRLPIGSGGGEVDLAEDEVDHAVEEVALAGHVVVERHRLDPEGVAELAHAERPGHDVVGERNGGAQHPFTIQGDAGLCGGLGRGPHWRSLLSLA